MRAPVSIACAMTVAASLLTVWTNGSAAYEQPSDAAFALPELAGQLEKAGALPGDPNIVSAAGVTRSETLLLTIEDGGSFEQGAKRRLVIVGGLNGDERAAQAVLGAVAWFKTRAPASIRRDWAITALPFGDPDRRARVRPYRFPPLEGFFDDPDQPESRYAWRWASFQAPDLVLEVWGGNAFSWQGEGLAALKGTALAPGSLAAAMSAATGPEGSTVPAVIATARASDGPQLLQQLLSAATGLRRSPLRGAIAARTGRPPLDIARVLANRYPRDAIVSYIPSVTWTNTLRLAAILQDSPLQLKVRQQTMPWLSGERPLFGERMTLAAAAGTMVYAELASLGEESARALAVAGAEAASAKRADGIAQHGQGWTDDMFMTASVLARTGRMAGRERDLDRMGDLLVGYAARLQREDGIFVHFTDGRQAWGRGNGFAALGLMEALTSLPAAHPMRPGVLAIYQRHMSALRAMQAPDGMWRQIVDQPGSYRETSVTSMVLAAMARGIRLGWLNRSYQPVVERAWRAVAAHVAEDGSIVDVCASTGAGPTRRYYFDRPAITGADDRGGAMALLASMEVYELHR